MKKVVAALIACYALYSVFSTGSEVRETVADVREMRDEVQNARELRNKLKPCKEETFQFCKDENSMSGIADCLRLNQSSLSESCAEAVRAL